jgi:hypothetical protein
MRFEIDMADEALTEASASKGERLEVHLYLNQSLFLPLQVSVVRIEEEGSAHRVGAEFFDKNAKGYKAFISFLQMLDGISEEARLQS